MLTTSVSLPENEAVLWRKRQRSILRLAVRSLRVQLRGKAVRRGVKRSYNRVPGELVIARVDARDFCGLFSAAK